MGLLASSRGLPHLGLDRFSFSDLLSSGQYLIIIDYVSGVSSRVTSESISGLVLRFLSDRSQAKAAEILRRQNVESEPASELPSAPAHAGGVSCKDRGQRNPNPKP